MYRHRELEKKKFHVRKHIKSQTDRQTNGPGKLFTRCSLE